MGASGTVWALLLFGAASGAGIAQTVPPGEAGRVRLMVMREVDSSQAKEGDVVRLAVDAATSFDGRLIPVGTPAFGLVERASDSGVALRRGKLEVRLTHLMLGEERIELAGAVRDRGEGGKADDAAKVLLAPMYILFARGNVAKLKAGEIVEASFAPVPAATPLS